MIEEKKTVRVSNQNIMLENRKNMSVSGVKDVDSFDENTVALFTELGSLLITGSDLHISRLNIENGEVMINGTIDGIVYRGEGGKKGGFLQRLIK